MSRYLLVGDIHLSDRPPSACTDTYLDDLFAILEHTVRLESELDVAGVIWSGDVFHHKQPSRTSHRTVQRAMELVQAYKRLWIVPGNHDMLHDRFDSVEATQPLGVLLRAGAELLNGWEKTGEHPIYGVPWLQEWTEAAVTEATRDWHKRLLAEGWRQIKEVPAPFLLVSHAPLYPPSLELPYEYYPLRDEAEGDNKYARLGWSRLMGNQGFCYYGHVHDAHGTYEVDGVIYCNQGAITRGSLAESDKKRAIAVTTWSPEEGFVRVDVPHKPADEIYRVMEIRAKEEQQIALDSFLDSIGQTRVEVTSIEDVIEQIRGMGLGDELVTLVTELLEEARVGH